MRLPDETDLGLNLPQASRAIPQYSGRNPAVEALQGFGDTLAKVGFSRARKTRSEADQTVDLGVQSRLLQFEEQWSNEAQNRAEKANPGAAGFVDGLKKDYTKAAEEFFRTVPVDLQPRIEQKLFTIGSRLNSGANEFQKKEADRWATSQIDNGQNTILNRVAANPDGWQQAQQDGEELIRNNPSRSLIEQDVEVQAWRKRLATQLFTTRKLKSEADARAGLGVAKAPGSVVDRIIQIESGGNVNAQAATSSAGGLGQFTDSTWLSTVRTYRPDIAAGKSAADILALKTDPTLGREMTARLTEQNAEFLRNKGIAATPGNLYLAHFLGSQGASNVIKADPGASIESVIGADAVRANSFLRGKTASGVIEWAAGKMGGASGPQEGATARNLPIILGDWKGQGRVSQPDVSGVHAPVMELFRKTQDAFGQSIPIVSGFRDPERNKRAGGAKASQHMHGNALDLDVSKLSQEERIALIRTASAQGFTGIGVYANSLHLDTGPRRYWGPDHHSGSLPGWAKDALDEHMAGTAKASPMATSSPTDGYSILSDPAPEYAALSYEDRVKLYEQSLADQRQADAATAAQETAAYAEHKDNFELGIETGTVKTQQDILADPVLNNGDKASLLRSFEAKNRDTGDIQQAVQLFRDGALQVDPFDAKGEKIVDGVFNSAIQSIPAEQVQPLTEELVRQTGVVPRQAMSAIRQGLESTDPGQVAAAAQSAQRISTVNPAALSRRTGGNEVQTAADDFRHYVGDLNLEPVEAGRRMIEARDPAKKMQRKALEPAAKEFMKAVPDVDLASEFGASSLGSSPAQALGLQAEFAALAEDAFYSSNGDPELAKSRAIEQMKRMYGPTEFAPESTVVKYPPERYWPKQSNTGFMGIGADPFLYAKNQLFQDVSGIDPEFQPGSIQLVTTPATEAMIKRGEMPAYSVLWTDENGVIQTMPGKLWRPDTSKMQEMERQKAVDEQQKTIDRARSMREDELNRARLQNSPDAGRDASLDAFIKGPDALPQADTTAPMQAPPPPAPMFDTPSPDELQATPWNAM